MKKKLLIRLINILVLINILLSSCSMLNFFHKKDKVVIEHHNVIKQTLIPCPKPNKPIYDKLYENKSICDIKNIEILMNDIIKMKYYINSLEMTIECYEKQIKNTLNDNDNKSSK